MIDIQRARVSLPLAALGGLLFSAILTGWKTSAAFTLISTRLDSIEGTLKTAVRQGDLVGLKAEIIEASRARWKTAVVLCPVNVAKGATHTLCEVRFTE